MDPRLNLAYDRVTEKLPAAWAGTLDSMRPSWRLGPWSGPLNGQRGRVAIMRDLLLAFPFVQIIETGTFRGGTTEFLSVLGGVPVATVEAVPRNFEFARRRLSGRTDVTLELDDSRAFLRRLALSASTEPVLFYLDAHWEEDLPLAEELAIIAASWPLAVVVIDDFQVPDDPTYAFDDYGPGKRLVPALLDESAVADWPRRYPVLVGAEDSGAHSGCVVLASPPLGSLLAGVPSLRSLEK